MSDRLMQFFRTTFVRHDMQAIATPYESLAVWIDEHLPACFERTMCLQRLLESRDAAVRAVLGEKEDQ